MLGLLSGGCAKGKGTISFYSRCAEHDWHVEVDEVGVTIPPGQSYSFTDVEGRDHQIDLYVKGHLVYTTFESFYWREHGVYVFELQEDCVSFTFQTAEKWAEQ